VTETQTSKPLRPMVRAGRLRSDIEDPGTVVHLTDSPAYCHGKALCGVAPGRRSVGWVEREGPATCPRCQKAAAR